MEPAVASQVVDCRLLERRLSVDRLAPYRAVVDGDLGQAIALYEWNGRMAAAFWMTLGDIEVVVRNAMHQALTDWSASSFGEPRWYLDQAGALTREARRDIGEARRRATRNGGFESPGRVVAELTMGFWRYLLAARYERTLWLACLRSAFPLLSGVGMRRDVHNCLAALHVLRNRIAHHEPIHNRPLWQLHRAALTAAGWVCPETRRWIEGRSTVERLLAERPGSVPRQRTSAG